MKKAAMPQPVFGSEAVSHFLFGQGRRSTRSIYEATKQKGPAKKPDLLIIVAGDIRRLSFFSVCSANLPFDGIVDFLTMYRDVLWSVNSDSHFIAANLNNSDPYGITDNYRLIALSREYKH